MSFIARLIVGISFLVVATYLIFFEKKLSKIITRKFPVFATFLDELKFKEGLEVRKAIVAITFLIIGIFLLVGLI